MPKYKFNQNFGRGFCNHKQYARDVVYIEDVATFAVYQELKGYYEVMDPEEFKVFVTKFVVDHADKNVTEGMVKDVIFHIKCGIHKKCKGLNSDYISLTDKLLNINSFEYEEYDRNKYSFFHLPYPSTDIEKGLEMPKFDKFLRQMLVDEQGNTSEELITVVQEMFGFYLINNMKGQMMFFLKGAGNNGKNVLIDILKEMIGKKFIDSQSIESLTTGRWSTASLVGKKINICTEEESKFLRSDKFKALVSGDPVSAERKYGGPFVLQPTTKYLIATNGMPSFQGLNEGLTRRIKIIPCNYKVPKHLINVNLTEEIIAAEMPAIIKWTLEGAKRLIKNKYQLSPCSLMQDMTKEFEDTISSASMHIRETYTEDEAGFVSYQELYENYREWCQNKGRKPMNESNFKKDINHVLTLPATKKGGKRGRAVKVVTHEDEGNPVIPSL